MNFCTLFDSNYAAKGIAMYLSLSKWEKNFVLYVMAMDRKCKEILDNLHFDNIAVECIEDIQDPELDKARSNRSVAEFCWTCGSYSTEYFLRTRNLPEITYLDSDLMFFQSPAVLLNELRSKNASVGLSPHFISNTLFGRYCVQFVYFKNDGSGRTALKWWKDECLKWCYSKLENGKYGDQKYLDYMSGMFDNVVEITNKGAGIAYWNVYGQADTKNAVFFHYSGIRINTDGFGRLVIKHSFYLSESVRRLFVTPYIELMRTTFVQYLDTPISSYVISPFEKWKYPLKAIIHIIDKIFITDFIFNLYLRIKYRKNTSPYSERTNG